LPESLPERIRHYVLDGSDRDLRRLLSVAEVPAATGEDGWLTSPFTLDLTLRRVAAQA
jgi:hypothetical protein